VATITVLGSSCSLPAFVPVRRRFSFVLGFFVALSLLKSVSGDAGGGV
jgi:hypothetical protein